jgi:hypothetical protein
MAELMAIMIMIILTMLFILLIVVVFGGRDSDAVSPRKTATRQFTSSHNRLDNEPPRSLGSLD